MRTWNKSTDNPYTLFGKFLLLLSNSISPAPPPTFFFLTPKWTSSELEFITLPPVWLLCFLWERWWSSERCQIIKSKGELPALWLISAKSSVEHFCEERETACTLSSSHQLWKCSSSSQMPSWSCCLAEWSLLFILLECLVLNSWAILLFEQTTHTQTFPSGCELNPCPTCSLPLRPRLPLPVIRPWRI